MRKTLLLGALVISAMLCGRSWGADMFGRMVSLDEGCQACAQPAPACEPCERAKRCDLFAGLRDLFASHRHVTACEACEPAKCAVPEPACAPECVTCRPQPVRHLVRKVLGPACPTCGQPDCNACEQEKACEPACEKPCEPACEPACKEPVCGPLCRLHHRLHCRECEVACEKPACEKPCEPACEPVCEPGCKPRCERPVLNFLRNLLGCEKHACVVSECGCGVEVAPAEQPAPKKAEKPTAPAPLPQAPNA